MRPSRGPESNGALDELLELVHALRSAYGDYEVQRLDALVEQTRMMPALEERIGAELGQAAVDHAEELLEQWRTRIDCAGSWVLTMGQSLDDLVVVVVDPLCPRLPEAADVFPDGASLQPRNLVARMLRTIAPSTARTLQEPSAPGTQAVIAFTFGRVLGCARETPWFGKA